MKVPSSRGLRKKELQCLWTSRGDQVAKLVTADTSSNWTEGPTCEVDPQRKKSSAPRWDEFMRFAENRPSENALDVLSSEGIEQ